MGKYLDILKATAAAKSADSVLDKGDSWRAEASRLGWPVERVAAVTRALGEDDEVAEVTADYIAVLAVRRALLRFYRAT